MHNVLHKCEIRTFVQVQMKMADKVIPDVTLASADHRLVLCWEEKVRLEAECSLWLKHSARGRLSLY